VRKPAWNRKIDVVSDWLVDLLESTSLDATEVAQRAEAAGISEATLRRASLALEVDKHQVHNGSKGVQRWVWSLPVRVPETDRLRDEALALLAGLVIDDGRRWGDAAVDVQWEDARPVCDPASETPYHWLGRSRGYDKTGGVAGTAVACMLTQAPAGARLYALASDRDQGSLFVDSVAGFVARTPVTFYNVDDVETFQP
jgi:hypothetical protein